MSNLVKHAKRELDYSSLEDKEGYEQLIISSVIELLELFSKQEHSGSSANYVIYLFNKLARFDILSPIEDVEEDWIKVSDNLYQNRRMGNVFKDEKGLFFLDAIIWKENDSNFFTDIKSRLYFYPPFTPKSFYVEKDSNGRILDKEAYDEAISYYAYSFEKKNKSNSKATKK